MEKDYQIIDDVLIIDEGRTEIGRNEFYRQPIKKAIIPEGVTKIDYWAFGSCRNLEEIVLPESIESISGEAFALCPLQEIVFTNGCPNLKDVTISSFGEYSPWAIKQRATEEFFMFGTKLFMHGEGPSSTIIPSDVEIIGQNSFSEIERKNILEEVAIPEGVKTIERSAFACCAKLKSVQFPSSLETIEDFAFSGCNALTEIVLPENFKTLGEGVFRACTSLQTIVFPKKLKTIGANLFADNYSSYKMNLTNVESLIPAMLNGCKLSAQTSMWFLENFWTDENSLKEIAVLYLTQSGTKVLAQAELILWRNTQQAINIMNELKSDYKLKATTVKKIDAFIEKHAENA